MNKTNLTRLFFGVCLAVAMCCLPLTVQGTNIRGDVNDDGTVNITDVTALINYLLTDDATGLNLANADLSADGLWNITDVTNLINMLLRCDSFTVNGVTFNMVKVQGGTFTMGATPEQGSDAYDAEKPAHEVTLSSFYIGETEVTQALWVAVMGSNPSWFSPKKGYAENLQRPVELVSWNDCQEFITKLNQMTGKTFRLPTEAEWEYAARGGNQSHGYKFAGSNTIGDVAWYYNNSEGLGSSSPDYGTHTVATKAPNELGLYDMTGNVWEWCQDWFDRSYYSYSPTVNPTGPASGSKRVTRGGSWHHYDGNCRVSCRNAGTMDGTWYDQGFRLAL